MSESHRALVEGLLEGTDVRLDGDRPWDIRVHEPALFTRILAEGTLGATWSWVLAIIGASVAVEEDLLVGLERALAAAVDGVLLARLEAPVVPGAVGGNANVEILGK